MMRTILSNILYETIINLKATIPGKLVHRNGRCAHCMLWKLEPHEDVCPVCFNGWR